MDRVAPSDPTTVPDLPERARPPRRPLHALTLGAVLVVMVLGLAFWWFHNPAPPPTRADVDRAISKALERAAEEQRQAPPDAATAYRTILPSLVTVVTGDGTATSSTPHAALGAGVIVSGRGTIVTALHVVNSNTSISVIFNDGTRTTARTVTRELASDIAVLAPDQLPQVVVPAVLGGGVQVGDEVFPVGNPLGLRDSLSAGVVSAVGRQLTISDGHTIEGLIQFDAAVNPGSSGGPLLDREGHVVGIVTALANPSTQPYFVGVGFAVPITNASSAAGGPQK